MANKNVSEAQRQTVVLIAFMIKEMALADGFKSLTEASAIHPEIVDIYVRYSAASLRAVENHQQRQNIADKSGNPP